MWVLAEGFARLDDLAQRFDVSLMTMHRDVDALESQGWLLKIRGGATANPAALAQAGVHERESAMRAEKVAIAQVAAEMVTHGQTVFLDDSTTVLALVPLLLSHPPMTIASNFLPVLAAVGSAAGIDLHLLGGQYHPHQEACFGRQTIEAAAHLHADIVFMSTTAITDGRCLHRSEDTVMVREALMRHSARKVLMVDHAKFGRPAPHLLCGVEDFDSVITDDGIDPVDLADLRARCGDVRLASAHG